MEPRETTAPGTPGPRPGPAARRLAPLAALVLAMISVQAGATFAKRLFAELGPLGAAGLRTGLGALLLFLIFRPWRGGRVRREDLPALLGYGVSLGLMNLVFYLALERIPLGLAVSVEFAGPLALAVAGSRRLLDVLWVALAGGGLLLLAPLGGVVAADPLGVGLALLAGGFWALYILFGARTGRALKSRAAPFGAAIAALLVAPAAAAGGGGSMLAPAALGMGLLVALLSSAIPYSLEMVALRNLPSRTFGVLMSGEPAVAALMGFALLGERLDGRQALAIALIVVAALGAALFDPPVAGADPP